MAVVSVTISPVTRAQVNDDGGLVISDDGDRILLETVDGVVTFVCTPRG